MAPRKAFSFIRFSSKKQELGDSLRRQVEETEKYAKDNGLRLANDTRLKALGVSGFSGKHIAKGSALGNFLALVEKKKVPPGTVLIVESLDRLSRMDVMDAYDVFSKIIRSGIEIHTLQDKQIYKKETLKYNIGLLYTSIGILFAANNESTRKAARQRSNWKQLQKQARKEKTIVTAKVPAWLQVVGRKQVGNKKVGGEIIRRDDRAAVVKEIFRLKALGMGKRSIHKTLRIAAELNTKGVKPFGSSEAFNDSYIQSVLTNRAVLGEYQPHAVIDGKRQPVGEVIHGYYPRIIEDDEFAMCQTLEEEKDMKRGRVSDTIKNLFGGILVEAHTGAAMKFIDRGSRQYLYSDGKRLNKEHKTFKWDYKQFEKLFLDYVSHLDWSEIHKYRDDEDEEEKKLDQEIKKVKKVIEEQTRENKGFLMAMKLGSINAQAVAINNKLQDQMATTNDELWSLRRQKAELKRKVVDNTELRALIDKGDFESRYTLRAEIRRQVARIELFSNAWMCIFRSGVKQGIIVEDGRLKEASVDKRLVPVVARDRQTLSA